MTSGIQEMVNTTTVTSQNDEDEEEEDEKGEAFSAACHSGDGVLNLPE